MAREKFRSLEAPIFADPSYLPSSTLYKLVKIVQTFQVALYLQKEFRIYI